MSSTSQQTPPRSSTDSFRATVDGPVLPSSPSSCSWGKQRPIGATCTSTTSPNEHQEALGEKSPSSVMVRMMTPTYDYHTTACAVTGTKPNTTGSPPRHRTAAGPFDPRERQPELQQPLQLQQQQQQQHQSLQQQQQQHPSAAQQVGLQSRSLPIGKKNISRRSFKSNLDRQSTTIRTSSPVHVPHPPNGPANRRTMSATATSTMTNPLVSSSPLEKSESLRIVASSSMMTAETIASTAAMSTASTATSAASTSASASTGPLMSNMSLLQASASAPATTPSTSSSSSSSSHNTDPQQDNGPQQGDPAAAVVTPEDHSQSSHSSAAAYTSNSSQGSGGMDRENDDAGQDHAYHRYRSSNAGFADSSVSAGGISTDDEMGDSYNGDDTPSRLTSGHQASKGRAGTGTLADGPNGNGASSAAALAVVTPTTGAKTDLTSTKAGEDGSNGNNDPSNKNDDMMAGNEPELPVLVTPALWWSSPGAGWEMERWQELQQKRMALTQQRVALERRLFEWSSWTVTVAKRSVVPEQHLHLQQGPTNTPTPSIDPHDPHYDHISVVSEDAADDKSVLLDDEEKSTISVASGDRHGPSPSKRRGLLARGIRSLRPRRRKNNIANGSPQHQSPATVSPRLSSSSIRQLAAGSPSRRKLLGSGGNSDRRMVESITADFLYTERLYVRSKNESVRWTGPWNDHDQPHGYGSMLFMDGQIYIGEVVAGMRHGQGCNRWKKSSKGSGKSSSKKHSKEQQQQVEYGQEYTGQWDEDHRSGRGTHRWPDGRSVTGHWHNGHVHGRIFFTWPDGSTYDGEASNGQKHGRGTHTYACGRVYSGQYMHGQEHGYGTLTEADQSSKYRGQFENAARHGYGIQLWPDKTYDGEWKANVLHGHGKLTWNNGACYTGEFVAGQYHGSGCYRDEQGRKFVGRWLEGRRHGSGKQYWPNGQVYTGNFLHGHCHGYGRLMAPDGSLFTGGWNHGVRSGRGIQVDADGNIVHCGLWKDDQPVVDVVSATAGDAGAAPDQESVTQSSMENDSNNKAMKEGSNVTKKNTISKLADLIESGRGTIRTIHSNSNSSSILGVQDDWNLTETRSTKTAPLWLLEELHYHDRVELTHTETSNASPDRELDYADLVRRYISTNPNSSELIRNHHSHSGSWNLASRSFES